jgi:hypothetical protein
MIQIVPLAGWTIFLKRVSKNKFVGSELWKKLRCALVLRRWNLKRYLIQSPFYMQNFFFVSFPCYTYLHVPTFSSFFSNSFSLPIAISLHISCLLPHFLLSKDDMKMNNKASIICSSQPAFLDSTAPEMELCRRLQDEEH